MQYESNQYCADQAQYWFEQEVRHALLAHLESAAARAEMERLSEDVAEGRATPVVAARQLLASLGLQSG